MKMTNHPSLIEVQVEKAAQLFHTLDPVPFRERDLDREAEDFIVSWARELPAARPIKIVVHLPAAEAEGDLSKDIGKALNQYFLYRAESVTAELRELFKNGRYSLVVGLTVLAICMTASRLLSAKVGDTEIAYFLSEGLLILGWVANWRPIEIFLYEWWPLLCKRRLYHRLSVAETAIMPR